MRKSKNRKQPWFYQSTEPGDEVGGIVIDFIFKYKMLDSGSNMSILVGQVNTCMENYKKGESLALLTHNGDTLVLKKTYFRKRSSLRDAIRKVYIQNPPKKGTRFPFD